MKTKLTLLCALALLCLPMTGCKSVKKAVNAATNVVNEVGNQAENIEDLKKKAKNIDEKVKKVKDVAHLTGKNSAADEEAWEQICDAFQEESKDTEFCNDLEFVSDTMEAEGLESSEGIQELRDHCC